jgi:hypothetical protein
VIYTIVRTQEIIKFQDSAPVLGHYLANTRNLRIPDDGTKSTNPVILGDYTIVRTTNT